jgi:uncharacterized integral membrane protein
MAVLKALILIPIVAIAVLFSVSNRTPVIVELDPLNLFGEGLPLSIPLFVVVFVAVALGVVIGGCAVWLAQGRYRKAARTAAREAARNRAEVERLRTTGPTGQTLPVVSSIR